MPPMFSIGMEEIETLSIDKEEIETLSRQYMSYKS
jgi:hypothetical protein